MSLVYTDMCAALPAVPFGNSSTPYTYSSADSTFHQAPLSCLLLSKFFNANKALLKLLKTSRDIQVGDKTLPAGSSVGELVDLGKDERVSVGVLASLFEELAMQTT